MPNPDDQFAPLLNLARQGDQRAAADFVARYSPHHLRVVRRTLNQRLRSKFDSQDFVQAVWASFFADLEHLQGCRGLEHVAAYLTAMARNKTIDEVRRRLKTRKHAVQVEGAPSQKDVEAEAQFGIVSADPTASQVAVARETWEQVVDGRSDRSALVFALKRQGATCVEIAAKLGVNERTVRRVIDRAERRLGGTS